MHFPVHICSLWRYCLNKIIFKTLSCNFSYNSTKYKVFVLMFPYFSNSKYTLNLIYQKNQNIGFISAIPSNQLLFHILLFEDAIMLFDMYYLILIHHCNTQINSKNKLSEISLVNSLSPHKLVNDE